jgi:hypothetical protein
MSWLREAPTEVVDRVAIHEGPYECSVTACEDPWCAVPLGECCEHCPAEYRRKRGMK